jgi:serine/threonine-protein kinase
VPSIDPAVLFSVAGLDRTLFTEAAPRDTPPMAFDQRLAWTGRFGNGRTEQVQVSAAYWQGRPVYFRVTGDWARVSGGRVRPIWLDVIAAVLFLTLLVGSVSVARRHARLGRGDRRGSARMAAAAFVLIASAWMLGGPHVRGFEELRLLVSAISLAAFGAAWVWALYMAVEPYVRRHWPDALISWTRVLAGQVRNPLVASHVLVGLCLELSFLMGYGRMLSVIRPDAPPGAPVSDAGLQGGAASLGELAIFAVQGLVYVIGFVLIIVLLRLLLRRLWIADTLGSILLGALLETPAVSSEGDVIVRVYFVLNAWALLWLLRRFGLLSMLVAIQAEFILVSQTSGGWDTWYVGWSLLPWALALSTAGWALWVILSGQRAPSADSVTA